MARTDIDKLLAPAPKSPPCGLDPEEDALWFELEALAEGNEGNQWDEEGTPPDWPGVRERAIRILGEAKHLQVAYWLTNAMLVTDGLEGLRDGIALMFGLCRAYWRDLYPPLDDEDDDPAYARMTILAELWVPPGAYAMGDEGVVGEFQQAMLGAHLADSKVLGALRWRDVLAANRPADTRAGDSPELAAAFANLMASGDPAGTEVQTNLRATQEILAETARELNEFDAFLTGELGSDGNLSGLRAFAACIDGMAKYVGRLLTGEFEGTDEGSDGPAVAGGGAVPTAVPRPAGEIQSREDVIRLLGRIVAWYENNEPSSPVPLILKRACGLVGADFWAIVAEIADDAERQVENVVGSRPSQDDDDD
ncbi:MAG: hypothetical protein HN380_00735 [Victivallales bacterium]|nr:hypothetical protein [Victivallales bacterium]